MKQKQKDGNGAVTDASKSGQDTPGMTRHAPTKATEGTTDEIKAEIAYEYQAEIDNLTRRLHDVLGMLDAADVDLPKWADGMSFPKAAAEFVALESPKEEWEVQTLAQRLLVYGQNTDKSKEIAALMNDGWEILECTTNSVYVPEPGNPQSADIYHTRFVTLRRKKAASVIKAVAVPNIVAAHEPLFGSSPGSPSPLVPTPALSLQGMARHATDVEELPDVTYEEALKGNLPSSVIKAIGNREAMEGGRLVFERRFTNSVVRTPSNVIIMQTGGE